MRLFSGSYSADVDRRHCTVHRDAFCQFSFRWIYHCHSKAVTYKKQSKMKRDTNLFLRKRTIILSLHFWPLVVRYGFSKSTCEETAKYTSVQCIKVASKDLDGRPWCYYNTTHDKIRELQSVWIERLETNEWFTNQLWQNILVNDIRHTPSIPEIIWVRNVRADSAQFEWKWAGLAVLFCR